MALIFVLLSLLPAVAAGSTGALRGKSVGDSFARSIQAAKQYKHKLRVCNAYPYQQSLHVLVGQEKLTQSPMLYQSCEEFDIDLKANDKIHFVVGDARAGTFAVADLPEHDAVLQLIMYRHDALSTGVAFESHVFANLLNAQLAVIDAYRGEEKSVVRIQDIDEAKTARSEELRFDSVVAVNPGEYQIVLEGADGEAKVTKTLVTKNRESYVIIRCGVQAMQGKKYPQELMVFPQQQEDSKERAGAASFVNLLSLPMLIAAVNFARI